MKSEIETERNNLPNFENEVKSNVPELLETREEKHKRMLSLYIIYFTMFLMTLGFSIILTGVYPFLTKLDPNAGKQFLGFIIAVNPLGQMLFSPVFGWWANKASSIRFPFICSLILFCLSSSLYASLELIEDHVKYWMLAARFFVGVTSANIVICRSYVASATTLKERTKSMSYLTLAQTLGFIFGPLIQGIFTPLGSQSITLLNKIHINMYTAPAWSNVLLGLFNIFLFLPLMFQDKRIAARENMLLHGKQSEKEAWKSVKPDYLVSWALIFSLFLFVFNFVLLESLGTPLTMENFAWSNKDAMKYMAYIMGAGGIVATLMFLLIAPLSKKFKESNLLIYGGFLLMVLGRVIHLPYGDRKLQIAESREFIFANGTVGYYDEDDEKYLGCPTKSDWCHTTPALGLNEFLIGYLLTSIGYPIGLTLINSIFSKIIGPRPQGLWQSLITGSGCFSRILGPLFVSFIYTYYGTFWLSLSTGLMMIIPMFWLMSLKDRLDIENIQLPTAKEIELMNVESNTKT